MGRANIKTLKEKLAIVKEAKEFGTVVTARKFKVSESAVREWIHRLDSGDPSFLKTYPHNLQNEVKRLLLENQQLKELVAEKELQIRIQNEFLKKK